MKEAQYEALVEEGLTLKRRARRDQARLMILVKEASDGGVLDRYCEDINLSIAAAGNYLAAHAAFLELGIIPDRETVDGLVAEMWENVFDPTGDGRFGYDKVDNKGIEAAAKEAGLKGLTKAKDIAKNPRSMAVAILGDTKCANAAADAVLARALVDHDLRTRIEDEMLRRWKLEGRGGGGGGDGLVIHDDEFFRKLYDRARAAVRRPHDIEDLPEHMLGFAEGRTVEMKEVVDSHLAVVRARRQLQNV